VNQQNFRFNNIEQISLEILDFSHLENINFIKNENFDELVEV
jgi:hypothetical protein